MILSSNLKPSSKEFLENKAYQQKLRTELLELISEISRGGGVERMEREHKRGKLTARERISELKDEGALELELSLLAGYELYEEKVPAGGIITAITQVGSRSCMVMAQDQTVKGGSYFPITVKKHLRAQEIAAANGLICLYLVDSGGAYLPQQSEVFPDRYDFGRIFYNQARMSAAGIPQLSSVHGACTAGGAYIPAMSEYTVMVRGQGRIFLAGPPLVKAATGEEVSAEDLGGAEVHGRHSGVVDELCSNDREALQCLRRMVAHLPSPPSSSLNLAATAAPRYPIEDILGLMPKNHKSSFDGYELLARLLDDSAFDPFKAEYAPTLICGWGRISGILVGILMNQGVLTAGCAQKGTHFIDLCDGRGTPLVFFQDISGFMVGQEAERGGIAKEGAKMVRSVALARVPKITMIIGGSHGAGNYAMCGRAFSGDFVFSWPRSRISVMGVEQAWFVLESLGKKKPSEKISKEEFFRKWERESSPYYASARLWDDGLIDPLKSREVLSLALAATLTKPPTVPLLRGVVRM